jgi:hypothetical protein
MSPDDIADDMFWRIHFWSGQGFSFEPQEASSADASVGAAAMAAAPIKSPAKIPQTA